MDRQTPHPQPLQPPTRQTHAPMVYVYERQRWKYKVVVQSADEVSSMETELNALGHDGWELVGVVPLARGVQFYFKRAER